MWWGQYNSCLYVLQHAGRSLSLYYIKQARHASRLLEIRLADGPAVLSCRCLLDGHLLIGHHILYYSACGNLGIAAFDGQAT